VENLKECRHSGRSKKNTLGAKGGADVTKEVKWEDCNSANNNKTNNV